MLGLDSFHLEIAFYVFQAIIVVIGVASLGSVKRAVLRGHEVLLAGGAPRQTPKVVFVEQFSRRQLVSGRHLRVRVRALVNDYALPALSLLLELSS